MTMKKNCLNCHFFSKEHREESTGRALSFSLTAEERKLFKANPVGFERGWYSLKCYMGVWDEGISPVATSEHKKLFSQNRGNSCFFVPYSASMQFQAAIELQKRNEANRHVATISQDKSVKKHNVIDGIVGVLVIICGVLAGAFGSDQLHFLMVLFVFLTISIALFGFFRHIKHNKRWIICLILIALTFAACSLWETYHRNPSFLFESQKPKTLFDSFRTDFSNLLRAGEDRILTMKDNKQITLKSQAYLDFESQTIFISFYIPDTPQTFAICAYLSENYKTALNLIKKVMVEQSGAGMQPVNTAELKFSGRIFIYHETPLLEAQRRELYALYKSKGLAPQFRDYQYLAEAKKRQ
jgi:hypothetical protein